MRRLVPGALLVLAVASAFRPVTASGAPAQPAHLPVIDRAAIQREDAALRVPRAALDAAVPPEWRRPLDGQSDFDVLDYTIAISAHPGTQTLDGAVTVRAKSLVSALTTVPLDLWQGMSVSSVSKASQRDWS